MADVPAPTAAELRAMLAAQEAAEQEAEQPRRGGRKPAAAPTGPLTDRRSLAKAGSIRTAQDLAELMTALMYDVLAGTVTPGEASAVINAGRQTLRLVELSLRYEVSGGTPLMQIAERRHRDG